MDFTLGDVDMDLCYPNHTLIKYVRLQLMIYTSENSHRQNKLCNFRHNVREKEDESRKSMTWGFSQNITII